MALSKSRLAPRQSAGQDELQDGGPPFRIRLPDIAALIVILVLLGAGLTIIFHPGQYASLDRTFTPEHVQLLGMVENAPQRSAHRVALILLALLSLAGIFVTARGTSSRGYRIALVTARAAGLVRRYAAIFIFAAAAAVLLLQLQGMFFSSLEERRQRLAFWLISIGLTLCGLMAAKRLATPAFAALAWACLVAYLLFLFIPGFMHTPFMSEPLLSWAEWHYGVTLAQGDRLAAGLSLGTQINLNYGLIPPVLLAVAERWFGLLDFGEHIRIVQVSQIVFLLGAIAAFYLWRPHNPLFVLIATLLTGPWVSTSHVAIFFPNQAGWRGFGFVAGILFLLLMRRLPVRRAALVLGGCAMLLVLYNPETGLCLSFGYGLFLLSRLGGGAKLSVAGALLLRAFIGSVVMFAAVVVLYRMGIGSWPPMKAGIFLGFITRFQGGYGSLPLYFDPLALIIFVHCAYIVALNTIRWWRRELRFDESVRVALAATILTWFAYYANRAHAWNLWTYQFLYAFLLADWLTPRLLLRLRRRGWRAALDARLAALGLIIIPFIFYANYHAYLSTSEPFRASASGPVTTLSGTSMPVSLAEELRGKAEFLARQDASSTLYFTRHSYLMPLLTRRFLPLSVQDAFAETITGDDFEQLVAEVGERRARVILFDAPGMGATSPAPAVDFYAQFYARLKARLAPWYEPRGVASGWEIWELRD